MSTKREARQVLPRLACDNVTVTARNFGVGVKANRNDLFRSLGLDGVKDRRIGSSAM